MIYDALEYFSLLDCDEHTDEITLKTNFREKAKYWHPDRNKSQNALETFQKLSKAYDVLKDKKLKTIYMLLSLIYTAADFPSLARLNTYKSAQGFETPYLRVFSIEQLRRGKLKTENLIGTYEDALDFLKKNTFKNFINGFWSPKFYQALRHNIKQITQNNTENLKLLVHNAAAFYDENKLDFAYLSALQAKEYASFEQQQILQNFLNQLPAVQHRSISIDTKKLRAIQLKPFFKTFAVLCIIAFCIVAFLLFERQSVSKPDKIEYYQTVKLSNGEEILDDLVTAKIFNIPIDKTDSKMLFHLTSNQPIMHGPSEKFDIITKAHKGQTVRLTGYTPDKLWFRIMLDNGEMGFIKRQYLKQGIGNQIPEKSQIISNP